jgi:hypothetical protein
VSAMFRSLRVANYRLWFAGAVVSNTGAWMQRTAQDWFVLTELTDYDAVAVGLTMALQFGPLLVLMPGRRLCSCCSRSGWDCSPLPGSPSCGMSTPSRSGSASSRRSTPRRARPS